MAAAPCSAGATTSTDRCARAAAQQRSAAEDDVARALAWWDRVVLPWGGRGPPRCLRARASSPRPLRRASRASLRAAL
jgi:hypothetical protein